MPSHMTTPYVARAKAIQGLQLAQHSGAIYIQYWQFCAATTLRAFGPSPSQTSPLALPTIDADIAMRKC